MGEDFPPNEVPPTLTILSLLPLPPATIYVVGPAGQNLKEGKPAPS